MASLSSRISFLKTSALKRIRGRDLTCTCGGKSGSVVVDRKYGVLRLERCGSCGLLFRTPVSTEAENAVYYQTAYQHGFTTDLPDDRELARLVATGFKDTGKDFTRKIEILRALGVQDGARILDFGCSWGYGTWQLRAAGFSPVGFEISQPRAQFAREKLGVTLINDPWSAPASFDVIYSSHVIEHLPDLAETIRRARRALRPGGLWVSACPNGSMDFRKAEPAAWHQLWGLDHPNFPDEVFFQQQIGDRPYFIAATPASVDAMRQWATTPVATCIRPLATGELLVAFKN